MVKVQDFSAEGFEKNIQHVEERVRAYKESPSFREAPEQEVVKKSFQLEASLPSLRASQSSVMSGSAQDDESGKQESFLPDYFLGGDLDGMREAIMRLAETALHGDLEKSLKDARKLSPYLEDAFHDALVDKIVPEMQRRGMI